MNDIQKSTDAAQEITNPDTNFKGYSLEELRYQRALVALQKEFTKSRIIRNTHNLQKSNPFNPATAASSLPGKMGFLASKLFTGINYLDYALIGFSIFGTARKVFSFFRKKKR